MKNVLALSVVAVLLSSPHLTIGQQAHLVDPLLGSAGGGNVFPGATLPFGMLKAGPDTGDNTANAGWTPDEPVNGFSQTHASGTGGGAKYGNILVQPTTGPIQPADHASPRTNEHAAAGFYGVTLSRYGVAVDLASARRTAIYRFTYPAGSHSNILLDASHCLSSYANQNEGQSTASSSIQIVSPTEMTGSSSITGGWNQQPNTYTVYFYATTDTPAKSSGTWHNTDLHPGLPTQSGTANESTGAWFTFDTQVQRTVLMKVGISFVSVAQAKRNALDEIPGFDLDGTKIAAEKIWDKALAPVAIQGASQDDLRQFYTAMYHTMLMPTDRTGENPLFQSPEPAYDDFYAIWDTFRSSAPWLTLVAERRQSDIVRSLVDLYRHEDWLPDARSGEYNGRVQGGSDADMMLADAYLKHLPGIDWNDAYAAVVHDAEVNSTSPLKQGRGDLDEWHRLGYLTIEGSDRPASKTMEYAANDYAVALFAHGLGKNDDFKKYVARAGNWKNLWNDQATALGFKGFIWSRHRDGSWKSGFDSMSSGTWGSDTFYEGNAWTYSTYVPQDVAALVTASGGTAPFVQRMDTFFSTPNCYDVGNEPGFLAPYLYLWAGRPDRTQELLRQILKANYHAGPKGLPGNDDSGAMSSWFAFAKIGIYPNAAQDVYLIGSPAYDAVTIHLANGKDFRIETEGNTSDKPYIASATWNGHPFNRTWFTHEDLMQGATLHFTMSATPTSWGSSDSPPSMSTTP